MAGDIKMDSSILSEEQISELLKIKTETKNIDFKEKCNWNMEPDEDKQRIVKDILAMSNTLDGGKIIFGIRDSDYEFVGLSEEDYKSFDQTKINDYVNKYTDPPYSCQVYRVKVGSKYAVVIDVPEFKDIPILCKKDAHSSQDQSKIILKKGQLYIRTEKGTSEAISTSEQMRELLGRAIRKRGDEILHSIELMFRGRSVKSELVYDNSKEKYESEISKADEFFSSKIINNLKQYGFWSIQAYPSVYKERLEDPIEIEKSILNTKVSLRGWNFPHTQRNKENGDSTIFEKGFQSYTIWDCFVEGYRMYQSGLFICLKAFNEDVEGRKSGEYKTLSFISTIWSITEFLLFFKRFYEGIVSNDEEIIIKINMNGCNNRKLKAFDLKVHLWDGYISTQSEINFEERVLMVNLKASYKEIATKFIKRVFYIFGWNDIKDEVIDLWQVKLLEKKY